ncbi:MAG: transmembrane protein 14C-like protein [Piptocephalis tieghemiana]|nr:MAG: transmembrane protein 14C-like protein [Piptocephalis tieghemiana]
MPPTAPTPTDIAGYSFALTILLGGVSGYAKAGSLASLLSGLVFGLAMAYAASKTSINPQDSHMAFGVCFILALVMGMRFVRTGKFMPAGLISIISLAFLYRYGRRLF